ncbi:MAG: hypothetical protein IKA32_04770 [Lentisphaeria bacterium]|nr:hypothetical protein [Lentisphaeria bacterium]
MKWNKNNVTTERRNWQIVIAKFDTSDYWFATAYTGWTGSQIETFRRAGKLLNAKTVEIKYNFDDNDIPTEPEENIITILEKYDGTTVFRQELDVPEGAKREFKYYELKDLLK